MKFKTPILALITSAILLGCASHDEVAMMADHRASVIESGLPYKLGPLNVMSAKSDGHMVNLLMIYNNSGTIAPEKLVEVSTTVYCKDNEVRAILKKGVTYHLTIRSERGKMLIEEFINEETCSKLDD